MMPDGMDSAQIATLPSDQSVGGLNGATEVSDAERLAEVEGTHINKTPMPASTSMNEDVACSSPASQTQTISSKRSLPSSMADQPDFSPTEELPIHQASLESLSPRSALGLDLPKDGEIPVSSGTGRRNLRQREREESIYLDAQDAMEALNFNLEEPVSLASPRDEVEDDPMEQLHLHIDNIGKS